MIDTPGLRHGANVSGRQIDTGPLVYAPEDVAETFVRLAQYPHDEVAVGWPARMAQLAYALTPGPTEHIMGVAIHRALDRAEPAARTYGALRAPPQRHGSPKWRLAGAQRPSFCTALKQSWRCPSGWRSHDGAGLAHHSVGPSALTRQVLSSCLQ